MAPFSHSSSSSSRQCWGAADEAAAKTQYPEARTTSHPRPYCLGPPRGELHGKRTEKRGRNTGAPALAPALALAQVFAAVQLGKLFFPLLREKEQSPLEVQYHHHCTALPTNHPIIGPQRKTTIPHVVLLLLSGYLTYFFGRFASDQPLLASSTFHDIFPRGFFFPSYINQQTTTPPDSLFFCPRPYPTSTIRFFFFERAALPLRITLLFGFIVVINFLDFDLPPNPIQHT